MQRVPASGGMRNYIAWTKASPGATESLAVNPGFATAFAALNWNRLRRARRKKVSHECTQIDTNGNETLVCVLFVFIRVHSWPKKALQFPTNVLVISTRHSLD